MTTATKSRARAQCATLGMIRGTPCMHSTLGRLPDSAPPARKLRHPGHLSRPWRDSEAHRLHQRRRRRRGVCSPARHPWCPSAHPSQARRAVIWTVSTLFRVAAYREVRYRRLVADPCPPSAHHSPSLPACRGSRQTQWLRRSARAVSAKGKSRRSSSSQWQCRCRWPRKRPGSARPLALAALQAGNQRLWCRHCKPCLWRLLRQPHTALRTSSFMLSSSYPLARQGWRSPHAIPLHPPSPVSSTLPHPWCPPLHGRTALG
mmetsp:Transcript_47319/g.124073  ORF Transcript_47319/g.124073 Transcript_47319/m.124073 type:complete len:261 (+) Transcript_47319:132-914(+)